MFFNIVFMMVLVSLLVQGWTIRPLARRLGLVVPPEMTIGEYLMHELHGQPVAGDRIPFGTAELIVREVGDAGEVTQVGLALLRVQGAADASGVSGLGVWKTLHGWLFGWRSHD